MLSILDNDVIYEYRCAEFKDDSVVLVFGENLEKEVTFTFGRCCQEDSDMAVHANAYRRAALNHVIKELTRNACEFNTPLSISWIHNWINHGYNGLCKMLGEAVEINVKLVTS